MSTKLPDATDSAVAMTEERLITEFGCGRLDDPILERWERVTGVRPHPFMRRGLFFAHRELTQVLDAKEHNKPILLYTGRGPSSGALHLGHLIPFILTKYLQDALDCYLVVQVTDDEKFIRDSDVPWATINEYTNSNIADILAQGFNLQKTFIMRESKYFDINVPFLTELAKCMTLHVVRNLFGFSPQHSVGYVVFPAKQIAPAFAKYFTRLLGPKAKDCVVLIPCGREQDPYFRYAREMSKRLKLKRVSTIYGKFIPALEGAKKMTASNRDSAIYLDDTFEEIERKLDYAGTKWTPAGADLEADVLFRYLAALDPDDAEVEDVRRRYGTGDLKEGEVRMGVDDVKAILKRVLAQILGTHQANKAALTQETIDAYEALKDWT
jgi:tryptophanyl-tRNA synthetase